MACSAGRCTARRSVRLVPAAALVQCVCGVHCELGWLLLTAAASLPAGLACSWVLSYQNAGCGSTNWATCLATWHVRLGRRLWGLQAHGRRQVDLLVFVVAVLVAQ